MKTSKEALAQFLGWDYADLKDNRYHAGRTSIPVYCCGNDYYCCNKDGKPPAKYISRGTDQSIQFGWTEIKDSYINSFGWKIWKA